MTDTRLRNRLIICWMMISAFWVAGLGIVLNFIRPAPGFAIVAPLAFGVPAVLLLGGIAYLMWHSRSGRGRQ